MGNYSVDLVAMGKRIRELRKTQNKTQKFFADMLYISPSYLALIEQGKRTVTLDVLAQISRVCGVSTDYLLFGEYQETEDSNYKTFLKLSENSTALQMEKALRLTEYYLGLENTSNTPADN